VILEDAHTGSEKYSASKTMVFAGGIYDMVLVAPLAIPGLASIQLNLLFSLNKWLGFSGDIPDFAPAEMLFVNLFGVIGLLWICRRLFGYEEQLLQWDLLLRTTISLLLLYYALTQAIHGMIWIFLAIELLFVASYCFVIWRKRGALRAGQVKL
jgi:hypothetical protein